MAGEESPQFLRLLAEAGEERIDGSSGDVQRGVGNRAVLWVDRRTETPGRGGGLASAIRATIGTKHLVEDQPAESAGINCKRTNEGRGTASHRRGEEQRYLESGLRFAERGASSGRLSSRARRESAGAGFLRDDRPGESLCRALPDSDAQESGSPGAENPRVCGDAGP